MPIHASPKTASFLESIGREFLSMNIPALSQQTDHDRRTFYDIVSSHDPRFDGCIFVGVKSTGVYCRPVCSVRMPKFANCTFYGHAAGAEKAGFRPCLICRPELAPGDAKVDAVTKLARLALRRIEDGALNDRSVDDLAREFKVCGRHMRRAVHKEFGITPVELAQTQRLLHAKQLLTETDMSVTDVAFTAGFASVRRFNALFKSRYRLVPTALRRKSTDRSLLPITDSEPLPGITSFRIDYRPPYNWDTLLAFLGARAIPGVEAVRDGVYLRTVRIGPQAGWIAVAPFVSAKRSKPIHALQLRMSESLQGVCVQVLTKVKTVFDTRANADDIDAHLSRDPLLKQVVGEYAGMRLPGAFDGFELLLRAILGQQVSVKGATTLAGRMAREFGDPITTPWPELTHLSPDVGRIGRANIDRITQIGMPGKRAETIRCVARAMHAGELVLAPGTDPDVARDALIAFPGIGEWTASYVAMRALAWPDALPLGDLGIKKALNLTRAVDILARTEAWRPWRAYAAIYLWLSLSGD
ncbi:MAG: helix-turn-helix domain-containing protein [Proteobacteria bacterium]|nr:helix-turn-helix domain-containing protein [Pseudomonadota bacterium]